MAVTSSRSAGDGRSPDGSAVGFFDRLFFTLVITAGTLLGVAPFCYLAGRRDWLQYVLIGTLLIAGAFAFSQIKGARLHPGPADRLVAAVSAIFPAANFGFMAMSLYGLVLWLSRGVNLVLGWLDVGFRIPAVGLAQLVGALLLFLMGLGFVIVAIQEVTRQLFPPAGTRHTSGLASLKQGKGRALATMLLAGVFLVTFLSAELKADGDSTWRYVFLQCSLMFATSYVWAEVQRARRKDEGTSVAKAVGDLLRQAGLEVEELTNAEQPGAGNLLRGIDYLARGDGRTLLVEIKAEQTRPVKWPAVAALTSAAWALAEERSLPTYQIEPFLLLVDTRAEEGLLRAAADEGVKILHLTKERISAALRIEGDDERKRQEALGLLTEAVVPETGS